MSTPDKHFSDWNTSTVQQLHFLVRCHFSANYNHEYIIRILEIIRREKKNWGAERSNENSLLGDTKKVSAVIDTAGEQKGKHTLYHSYCRSLMVLSARAVRPQSCPHLSEKTRKLETVQGMNLSPVLTGPGAGTGRCFDDEIHKNLEIGWESEQEPS